MTWEGYQDQEVIYPFYRLQEDNFEIDISASKPGEIHGILGTKMIATKSITEINPEDYDLLILPGGVKAIEKLRQEQRALTFIKLWDSQGKIIGSTCHGAQLLISAKVVRGRKISGYYSIKDDIINAGAEYSDAPFAIDRNIVSSPHYKHMAEWMKETIHLFNEKNAKFN